MKGIQPALSDVATAEANWRTAVEVLDEEYFKVFFDPGMGQLDGVAVPVPGERAAVIEFPDAVTSAWRMNARRKFRWAGAGLALTLLYSSPVGSTNNFRVVLGARAFDVGSVVSALADLAISTSSIPGPAVANTVLSKRVLFAPPLIPGSFGYLTFRVARLGGDAADTNVNTLRVYGLLLEVLPRSG